MIYEFFYFIEKSILEKFTFSYSLVLLQTEKSDVTINITTFWKAVLTSLYLRRKWLIQFSQQDINEIEVVLGPFAVRIRKYFEAHIYQVWNFLILGFKKCKAFLRQIQQYFSSNSKFLIFLKGPRPVPSPVKIFKFCRKAPSCFLCWWGFLN